LSHRHGLRGRSGKSSVLDDGAAEEAGAWGRHCGPMDCGYPDWGRANVADSGTVGLPLNSRLLVTPDSHQFNS
jgi:hypothetical protein